MRLTEAEIEKIKNKHTEWELEVLTCFRTKKEVLIRREDLFLIIGGTYASAQKRADRIGLKPLVRMTPAINRLYRLSDLIPHSEMCKTLEEEEETTTSPMDENDFDDESGLSLEKVSLEEAKRRAEVEKVKNMRLKNAQLLGELIPSDQVDRELATQAALHISLLRNEQAVFPNLLEHKSREEIEVLVRQYHHDEIQRLHRELEKRNLEALNSPVISDLILGILQKLDDGETVEGIMQCLNIEHDVDYEEEVAVKRYERRDANAKFVDAFEEGEDIV